MTYMLLLDCALKLVEEIILYYDARSKKHQITLMPVSVSPSPPTLDVPQGVLNEQEPWVTSSRFKLSEFAHDHSPLSAPDAWDSRPLPLPLIQLHVMVVRYGGNFTFLRSLV